MRRRACTIAVLLGTGALAAGCGQASAERKAMERKFDKLDLQFVTYSTMNAAYGSDLERVTTKYIALVRRYKDLLGPEEAKKRLRETSDEVAPYCLPCAGELSDEARRY